MAAALHGKLRDFGISEVFQLIGQQGKSGILEVGGDEERIDVAFLDGSVAWAATVGPHEDAALGDMLVRVGLLTPDRLVEIERLSEKSPEPFRKLIYQHADVPVPEVDTIDELVTRETLFKLLLWSDGSFHFHAHPVRPRRPDARALPAEQILMDGLRMVDEWRTFHEDAVRDDRVLERRGRFETYRAAATGASASQLARAERLFLLVDGRLATRRVIDLSRLGTFEGARHLSGLLRAGVLAPVAPDADARSDRRRRLVAREGGSVGDWLRATLPLAALALVALAIQLRGPAPAAPGALWRDARAEAHVAFETRRLRNALEAWQFVKGEPGDPAELVRAGWLPGDAVATGGSGPYHGAVQDGAGIVLAPEY